MKFRKKPVEVEAVQLTWANWGEMCKFADVGNLDDGKPAGVYLRKVEDEEGGYYEITEDSSDIIGMLIPTMEGIMIAEQDDWIIRGVEGELYPCKPSIFEKSYERVE